MENYYARPPTWKAGDGIVGVVRDIGDNRTWPISEPKSPIALRAASGKGMTVSERKDRVKYADCMTFVRYRLQVVDRLLNCEVTTGFEIPDMESICLQFRKVFELIAMSSLCANREKFKEARARFDKTWNANQILKFIERLNPRFYPVPISRQFDENGKGGTISPLTEGFLTRDELAKAHGRCGHLLHAENPYRDREQDAEAWRQRFRVWRERTMTLLRLHTTQLVDDDTQWWVVMRFGTDQPVQVAEMRRVGVDGDIRVGSTLATGNS